jgi:hypothetical protein
MAHTFAKAWDHTLKIKHIWMDSDPLPSAEETIQMGKDVAAAIRNLQARIPDTSDLWHDLDNCAEGFLELDGIDNAHEARDVFNDALSRLYDEADRNKRIWID